MMRLAVISLIGISVVAFPCAYDTDPREPAAATAIIAKLFPSNNGSATAVRDIRPLRGISEISP